MTETPSEPEQGGRATVDARDGERTAEPREETIRAGGTSAGEGSPVQPMEGFSWVVDGELAAMPLPGRHQPLNQDIEFLHHEGIRTLISLTEKAPDREALAARLIEQVHIPVRDFTAPTLEQVVTFVAEVTESTARGEPVGVHCTAGLGRSGTMVAAYLVARGATAEEAMAEVRHRRPGSIETEVQEQAIRLYEENLKSISAPGDGS